MRTQYVLTERKIKREYTRLNKLVFYNLLPPSKEIKIIFLPECDSIIAETRRYFDKLDGKFHFAFVFRLKQFPCKKLFREILLHEMIHLIETLEHGIPLGHGKHFFKWKKRLENFGFKLKVSYKF